MTASAPVLTGAWNYPTRVLSGPGRIAELADACRTAGITKPLIVTDGGLVGTPILASAEDSLKKAGLAYGIFSDVKGNPTESNVTAGLAVFTAGGHDGVIAFGGGSALDVGKSVAFMNGQTRPIFDYEDVGDWWTRANAATIAPIVAVPTTAGTGSEVGRAAVVTNEATHEKKIIFHPLMLPKVVIADPELTVGLPPKLTAGTGFDALTHCFEAYCAPGFHPMADGIALEGLRLVSIYLPRAVANGRDIEARSRMLAAASMGAAAFQKGLGAVHSISHPVGAFYDTHHGLTNGVVLPYVMLWNRPAIEDRMDAIARLLDLPGRGFDGVLAWILQLRQDLGIANSLADLGVDESRIAELAVQAERDPSTGGNPRPMVAKDFEPVILAAIRGDLTLKG
ncbi:iron-containing alcohol dehydrogenase [Segnochrobactrum spirostomi]|uniref:Alcohol dehydrogenase 2 n=1 Tax=Segnochrobactrum spirostomi TaxID=2608987 RepID=A0A6A7Y0L2_9HYPH|nr:iron-containing alcohol dehydrogenase [Segnochrobactrum spirostomi]MQT11362.1 iron-containing alcohol dehydrogenase [Segnochrobactrum spirostomi]